MVWGLGLDDIGHVGVLDWNLGVRLDLQGLGVEKRVSGCRGLRFGGFFF